MASLLRVAVKYWNSKEIVSSSVLPLYSWWLWVIQWFAIPVVFWRRREFFSLSDHSSLTWSWAKLTSWMKLRDHVRKPLSIFELSGSKGFILSDLVWVLARDWLDVDVAPVLGRSSRLEVEGSTTAGELKRHDFCQWVAIQESSYRL